MDVMESLSQSLAGAVEQAGQSVVRVEARRGAPGSGIVWSADGAIVTAEHVLERDDDIRVGLPDGREVAASVSGRDATTDVALLRAEAPGLPPVNWGDLSGARVGQLVLALSRPGRTVRAHLGIISALGDSWRTPSGAEIDRYLQADVDVRWGFSGGLLVTQGGRGLGMTTAGLLRRTAPSLAIPFPTLEKVVDALRAHGRIRRGYLGIGAQPVRLPSNVGKRVGQPGGVMIMTVEPGSPADQSGLVLGDVVLAIDGAPVRHHGDIAARLGPDAIGRSVTARILRAGAVQDVAITVGER